MADTSRPRHPGKTVAIGAAAAVLSAAAAFGLLWNLPSGNGPKTAAILDQLSLTQPDPGFVSTATAVLEQAGYGVDYYPGEEVTVDLYKNLPSRSYDLVLLRVHSGMAENGGQPTGYVSLFSGEPYTETKYTREAGVGLLGRASYYHGSPEYFGVVPAFVRSVMVGNFDGATVVLMGCDGLHTTATAEAFIDKGARAVVGWSGPVSPNHTDLATEHMLRFLLADGLPLVDAVAQTMGDVGPDPSHGSALLVYPSQE